MNERLDFSFEQWHVPTHTLAERIQQQEKFQDKDGYDIEILAGAIHAKGWVAWVELRERMVNQWVDVTYTLKVLIQGKIQLEWQVETYNPYFGCHVEYIGWYDDKITLLYGEKHSLYGATLDLKANVQLVELGYTGDSCRVMDDIAFHRPYSSQAAIIRRYQLPQWEALTPLKEEEALNIGLLIPMT